ncbi:MAG: DNA replication/repair protein RecF [Opitutales bacterium]
MRLLRLHAQHFRNFELVRLSLSGASHFLVGANGQGKTNLLEAAGLLGALRSFRTNETAPLIKQGEPQARIFYEAADASGSPVKIDLTLATKGKTLLVDGERVGRLGDFLGRFPVVVLSSDDNQLLRGSPGARRRFLDLHLASIHPGYYEHLRRYHRALASRNRLLKVRPWAKPDLAALASFEEAMAPEAAALVAARLEELQELEPIFAKAYAAFAEAAETPRLSYAPSLDAANTDAEAFRKLWQADRERELRTGATGKGPHRDDLGFAVLGRPAREFGSEGQQRSFVIALRLAQFARMRAVLGQDPLVLADDVLGELDPGRRARFWHALEGDPQILATGTSLPKLPSDRAWSCLSVQNGSFTPLPDPSTVTDADAT